MTKWLKSGMALIGLVALFLGWVSVTPILADSAVGAEWYIAPDGSDSADGTLDRPLATLSAALEKLRAFRKENPDLSVPTRIRFLPGRYNEFPMTELAPTDSGTAENPLMIEGVEPPTDPNAPDSDRVILAGSIPIGPWKRSGFRGRTDVWEADLSGTPFAVPQGGERTAKKIGILYWDDRRLTEARYPNFDPDYPYAGGYAYVPGRRIGKYDSVEGENPTILPISPEDLHSWERPEEGSVCFFNRFNYGNEIVAIDSVDREAGHLGIKGRFSVAARAPDRFFLFGLAEELDAPGEWYQDVASGKLYVIPPVDAGISPDSHITAAGDRTLIRFDGVSHLRVRGLSFTGTEKPALAGEKCEDVRVEKCRFYEMTRFEEAAVEIEDSLRCAVSGCDIWNTGGYGVSLSGGDAYQMKRSGNVVENSYFHHTGRLNRHGFAMNINGCGARIANNLCHDLPRGAIIYSGAFHLFENNEFRHINTEVEDTGATYTDGNNWIGSRGSIIRRNHVKMSVGYAFAAGEYAFFRYAFGFYLDENCGGVDVYENLVEDCSLGALHLHNARDNHLYNNIFVNCGAENGNHGFQLSFQGWRDEPNGTFYDRLPMMIDRYERATKLPAWRMMRGMIDPRTAVGREDKTIMTGNWVERNIFYFPKQPESLYVRHDLCSLEANAFDWNLVWNGGKPVKTGESPESEDGEEPANGGNSPDDSKFDGGPEWEAWRAKGADIHSVVADPHFVDPENGDYRLKPDSPAFSIGFSSFPLDQFGPYADPDRASWPISEAEGLREHPEWLRIPKQPVFE